MVPCGKHSSHWKTLFKICSYVLCYYTFPLSRLIFMYLKQLSTLKVIFMHINGVKIKHYAVIMLRLCVCVCVFNCFKWEVWLYAESKKFIGVTFTPKWGSVQFSSVTQSCRTLCNPMNCSTPGLPDHHQLLEFTQTHVDRLSDAIQPSHPLSSPSPPAPNPSQHQGLFQWANSSHEVAKVLEFQL